MLTNIANLGVKLVSGQCSYQVFRLPNGAWAKAQYQVGTKFQIEDASSDRGMILIDPDGDKLWVPSGEIQCFQEGD